MWLILPRWMTPNFFILMENTLAAIYHYLQGRPCYRITVLAKVPHTCIIQESSIFNLNLKQWTSWDLNLGPKGATLTIELHSKKYYICIFSKQLTGMKKVNQLNPLYFYSKCAINLWVKLNKSLRHHVKLFKASKFSYLSMKQNFSEFDFGSGL